jgi:hypothetical protein
MLTADHSDNDQYSEKSQRRIQRMWGRRVGAPHIAVSAINQRQLEVSQRACVLAWLGASLEDSRCNPRSSEPQTAISYLSVIFTGDTRLVFFKLTALAPVLVEPWALVESEA